jgi:hypothetical protein
MTASVTSFNFWVGDVVRDKIDHKLYEVKKINPKNVKCLAADGRTWNVDFRRLVKASDVEEQRYRGQVLERETTTELLRLGHVVKFKVATKPAMQGLFVVTKENPDGFNLVNLGGNLQRQYYRTVPAHMLEKVDGVITVTNV